ncbi:CBS domain-containing protein [Vagococcus sp. PNs007]|uniref:CBS domain-containing protein n=1 Tax=Vagococcus proximus TaxID=2991417 RepID=A0ABT5X2Z4_9ENTE|nr:cyclic-di-AMP-binding protein CbpB [Vagococcus proximus]MDF0480289.1 CBS domain-containing protein [Vagococcus proximus]
MIGNKVKELLLENEDCFLIPDEKVAHVMDENPLNHALLVLSKVSYSRIPVLNRKGEIVGLIGLSHIMDAMFDLTEIDPENLNGRLVKDVMDTAIKTITLPYDIEYIMHLLVDHPFVPVVDENNCFAGIVTRREILKSVNHLAHSLESTYELNEK